MNSSRVPGSGRSSWGCWWKVRRQTWVPTEERGDRLPRREHFVSPARIPAYSHENILIVSIQNNWEIKIIVKYLLQYYYLNFESILKI